VQSVGLYGAGHEQAADGSAPEHVCGEPHELGPVLTSQPFPSTEHCTSCAPEQALPLWNAPPGAHVVDGVVLHAQTAAPGLPVHVFEPPGQVPAALVTCTHPCVVGPHVT